MVEAALSTNNTRHTFCYVNMGVEITQAEQEKYGSILTWKQLSYLVTDYYLGAMLYYEY